MVAREDPWWWVAVGLLIGLLILATLTPVYIIKPLAAAMERLAASPPEADLSISGARPGLALPILSIVTAVCLVALSGWKIYDEKQSGSRWTWMLVAAGITLMWAMLMLIVTMKTGARLVSFESHLPHILR